MSSLTQTIGNMTFKSPIVAASGPVTDTVEKIKSLERAGVGAVSYQGDAFSSADPGLPQDVCGAGPLQFQSQRHPQRL